MHDRKRPHEAVSPASTPVTAGVSTSLFALFPPSVMTHLISRLPTLADKIRFREALGRQAYEEATEQQATRWASLIYQLKTLQPVDIQFNFYNLYFRTESGEVYAAGGNGYGQLGIGSAPDLSEHMRIRIADVKQLAVGDEFAAVLTEQGDVLTWGCNEEEQLGIAQNRRYKEFPCYLNFDLNEDERIVKIALGASHCIALSNHGRVFMWGGPVGIFSPFAPIHPPMVSFPERLISAASITLQANERIVDIKAGTLHTELITNQRNIVLGQNIDATDTDTQNEETFQVLELQPGETILVKTARSGNYAAITSEGRLMVWGANSKGRLGLGHFNPVPTPTEHPHTAEIRACQERLKRTRILDQEEPAPNSKRTRMA